MVLGLGTDLVKIRRMDALLERFGPRAERRLFTPEERTTCRDRDARARCYAARFAAKEACLKALGTGLGNGVGWQDLEVRSAPSGNPSLHLSGAARERLERVGGERVLLSLTHEAGLAAAVVVVDGTAPGDAPSPAP